MGRKALVTILTLFPLLLFSAEIRIQMSDQELTPFDDLTLLVDILHTPEEKVDSSSFLLGGVPVALRLVGEGTEEDQVVTSYLLNRPLEEGEAQILPPLSVLVNGERITHPAAVFQPEMKAPEEGIFLRGYIYGEQPFYPGEKVKFVYRIYYRGNIELTKEELPLLDATGFEKVGALQVTEGESKGYFYQEFSQMALVKESGSYSFPASLIEGKLASGESVKSAVSPFAFVVEMFPSKNRPLSFIGLSGRAAIQTELLSPQKLSVGEVVKLKVLITGSGSMSEAKLPDLFCQPGFSGFFSKSSLPVGSRLTNQGKEFYVELRAASPHIKQLPSIEISTFDVDKRDFVLAKSRPIPLTVAPSPPPPYSFPDFDTSLPKERTFIETSPEILRRVPSPSLQPWILVFGLLLLLQWIARAPLLRVYRAWKESPSRKLWAVRQKRGKEAFLKALYRLFERNKKAKPLLIEIEKIRYGHEPFNRKELLKWAKRLLESS